jgi:hypothetical protein
MTGHTMDRVAGRGALDDDDGRTFVPPWSDDDTRCPICLREACEDHLPAATAKANGRTHSTPHVGLDPAFLADAAIVAAEGKQIDKDGVPYLVDGLIPAYGMLGMLVAFSKVGKTTFAQRLAAAVAMGRPFLGRATQQARVLILAAEDPPEYSAWLARDLDVTPDVLTFYRHPHQLDAPGLAQIAATVVDGTYGAVLIASWQAVVSHEVRDENDNAAGVRVVERVKAVTRELKIPWLIDAHSGKGEDQSDDADPSRAMRGASAAAGAADYTLSLRYANGPFGSRRRLSGKGRFVNFAPLVLDYAIADGYTVVGTTKDATIETTWRMICETGALTAMPRTVDAIARVAGLVADGKRCNGHVRRQITQALSGRDGVDLTRKTRGDTSITLYARPEGL